MIEIAEELPGADDGAGHQLREEGYEERVVDGIDDRFLFAAINIDDVGHALERVKANAQWEDDAEGERAFRLAEQVRDIGGEEVVVLKKAEQPEIRRQAHDERYFAGARRFSSRDPARGRIID